MLHIEINFPPTIPIYQGFLSLKLPISTADVCEAMVASKILKHGKKMTWKQNKERIRQLTDSLISPVVEIRLWGVVLSTDILAAGFSLTLCGSHIIDTEKIQFAGNQSIDTLSS